MKKLFLILLSLLLLLVAIVLFNTFRFPSKQTKVTSIEKIKVNEDAIQHLAQAIQFKTISNQDSTQITQEEFIKFHAFLEQTFPKFHAVLKKEIIGQSLLFTWKGRDDKLKPILLMAHQDVVPANDSAKWSVMPFDGKIKNNFLIGRGTLDDKSGMLGILEAVEILLSENFKPARTIYFAFGHDEEVSGTNGNKKISQLLQSRGVELETVLDEGGTILQGVIKGIHEPIAFIGIAEKGYTTLELSVETEGGHSSMPPPHTAIGILSNAVTNLEKNPFPATIKGATKEMFDFIGPEMDFVSKMAFANQWLFKNFILKKLSSANSTNASIRTTIATTIFQSGDKENVLPQKAKTVINFRILPGDSIQGVISYVRKTINDDRIQIHCIGKSFEPSATDDIHTPDFNLLQQTIKQIFPEVIVSPYLTIASTDSKHYAPICKQIYRFLPVRLKSNDLIRIHGVDEQVGIENYKDMVRFYVEYIKNVNLHSN